MSNCSEDLNIIQQHGVPLTPRPEFVTCQADGSVTLSASGRAFYRLALAMHGLSPESIEQVRDLDGLKAISLSVKRVRVLYAVDEAERERLGGRTPVRARGIAEAALRGTARDLQSAIELRILCESAGDNVIPFPGIRRTQQAYE